jgi:hypothetical protein
LQPSDNKKIIEDVYSGSSTITIPSNSVLAFPDGFSTDIVTISGSTVTSASANVSLNGTSSGNISTDGLYKRVKVYNRNVDEWVGF